MIKADPKTMVLINIRNLFITAARHGAGKDEPEGSRCIYISDTLANEMFKMINEVLE